MLAPKGRLCALLVLIKQTCLYARNPPSFSRPSQLLGWHWLDARPPVPNQHVDKPTGEAGAPHSVDKASSAETPRIYLYPKHHWAGPKIPLAVSILIPNVHTMEKVKHDVKKKAWGFFFFRCKKIIALGKAHSCCHIHLLFWGLYSAELLAPPLSVKNYILKWEKKYSNFSLPVKPLITCS